MGTFLFRKINENKILLIKFMTQFLHVRQTQYMSFQEIVDLIISYVNELHAVNLIMCTWIVWTSHK